MSICGLVNKWLLSSHLAHKYMYFLKILFMYLLQKSFSSYYSEQHKIGVILIFSYQLHSSFSQKIYLFFKNRVFLCLCTCHFEMHSVVIITVSNKK